MSILQLFNLILFWIFFGCIASYFAQKRGRHPILWFVLGLVLGVVGILLLFVLPKKERKSRVVPPPRLDRSEQWLKLWYYVDAPTREQKGPMEFTELAQNWKEKQLSKESYIWGEGMGEWKKLNELPEVVKDLETANTGPQTTKKR